MTFSTIYSYLIWSLVENIESSREAKAKETMVLRRQKVFKYVSKSPAIDVLHDFAGLQKRVGISDKYETELLASASSIEGHVAGATAGFREALNML